MSPPRRERDDDQELVHVNVLSDPPARSETRVEARSRFGRSADGPGCTVRRSDGRWRQGHGAVKLLFSVTRLASGEAALCRWLRDQLIPTL